MTPREQKIERVREACVKVNGEIVELKFGCQVIIDDYLPPYNVQRLTENAKYYSFGVSARIESGAEIGDERVRTMTYKSFYSFEIDKVKIIGRPIRLADVLLAMQAIASPEDATFENLVYRVCTVHWNPRADDLTLQSDPTIDFLDEVLGKK